MPLDFIDLVVTSPPYGQLRQYDGYSFDFEIIAKNLFKVLKTGGIIIWVVADQTKHGSESGESFRQALFFKSIGFNIHDTMIYAKKNYMPLTHNRYEQAFEYMFVFSKGKPKTFNPILEPCLNVGTKKNRSFSKSTELSYAERKRNESTQVKSTKIHPNIFFYVVGANDKTNHTAPFPEQLVHDQIISWSNENDLIYDPFMGSGTTAKMAKSLKRNYIGSEISEKYCEMAALRLNKTNFNDDQPTT